MPAVPLLDVVRELDGEIPLPGELEGSARDDLPFIYDGKNGIFLVICDSGLTGVWLHTNWKDLNRIQLENMASIIGPPSGVHESGDDYAPLDPDEEHEWPNMTAVWNCFLTPLEIRDLILWCRDRA